MYPQSQSPLPLDILISSFLYACMDSTWTEQQLCAQQCKRHQGHREERDQVQDSRSSHQSREWFGWGGGWYRQSRDVSVTLKSNVGHVSMHWIISSFPLLIRGFCHAVEDQAAVNVFHSMLKAQRLVSPFFKVFLMNYISHA